MPGQWTHEWRPVQFTLVVDDFGVKYVGEEHAMHLKTALEADYTVTTKWEGKRYIGIKFGLGLQETTGPSVNAKLCDKDLEAVQTRIETETGCTLPCSPHQIWRQETIRNTSINGATTGQER